MSKMCSLFSRRGKLSMETRHNGDASATLQCDSTGHGQDSAPGSLQNLCSPEQVSATMALEPSKKNGYRRLRRELPSRKDLHSQGQVASISFSKVTRRGPSTWTPHPIRI